ncbi:MAG: hypothetical protein WCK08_07605 [Betaproteobacteria bacterium]
MDSLARQGRERRQAINSAKNLAELSRFFCGGGGGCQLALLERHLAAPDADLLGDRARSLGDAVAQALARGAAAAAAEAASGLAGGLEARLVAWMAARGAAVTRAVEELEGFQASFTALASGVAAAIDCSAFDALHEWEFGTTTPRWTL